MLGHRLRRWPDIATTGGRRGGLGGVIACEPVILWASDTDTLHQGPLNLYGRVTGMDFTNRLAILPITVASIEPFTQAKKPVWSQYGIDLFNASQALGRHPWITPLLNSRQLVDIHLD